MSTFSSLFRWLQRKRYQYEVTFSLYMLTPTEKFIFNSFIFLFFSMILIAASLYLPQHINFLINRAWFYWHGDDNTAFNDTPSSSSSALVAKDVLRSTGTVVADMAKETISNLSQSLKDGVKVGSGGGEL